MATSTSYRLPTDLKQRLARQAGSEGITETSLVTRLLHQGLDALDHPGIVHRPGPTGWRAGVAGGPDVDEVVRAVRTSGASGEDAVAAAADRLGIASRLVRIAIDYAAAHLEEVEARIRENEAAAERARKLAESRAAVLSA